MPVIRNIAIHHAGGSAADPFASSGHLSLADIEHAHKRRWNFKSSLGWYSGYNAVYDPKTGDFVQTRALGEETAAQFGHNFDTFSLCILGNFSTKPGSWPRQPVDPLTEEIQNAVTLYLHDLIEGNIRRLSLFGDTRLELSLTRVYPHRFFGKTDCYGSFISDSLFRDLLIAKRAVPVTPLLVPEERLPSQELERRAAISQQILRLWSMVADLRRQIESYRRPLGAGAGRECAGFIIEE